VALDKEYQTFSAFISTYLYVWMTLLAREAKLEIDTSPPSEKPIRNKAARFVNDVEILYLMLDAKSKSKSILKPIIRIQAEMFINVWFYFFSNQYPFSFRQSGE